jgi:hypothetical protein
MTSTKERVLKLAVSRMENINNPEFDELHTLIRTLAEECERLRGALAEYGEITISKMTEELGADRMGKTAEWVWVAKLALTEHDQAMAKLLGGV